MDDQQPDPVLTAYLERRPALIRYFSVRLRSVEAAEELVQDIYLKIARRPAEAIENPDAFLFRLGSNLMLDRIKRDRRAKRRIEAYGVIYGSGGEPAADEPAADDALAARQRLQTIVEAVKALPAPAQTAFRLHKLEGLSHAETAAAMGVSRSSVEKYLMACLKQIQDKVGRP
ncbi:MAG: RNA polymerase sigma factor [Caulobacteraceae bacterium]|nr:RNA polymerase sigma factor [Caulobacteraceae bacterium]